MNLLNFKNFSGLLAVTIFTGVSAQAGFFCCGGSKRLPVHPAENFSPRILPGSPQVFARHHFENGTSLVGLEPPPPEGASVPADPTVLFPRLKLIRPEKLAQPYQIAGQYVTFAYQHNSYSRLKRPIFERIVYFSDSSVPVNLNLVELPPVAGISWRGLDFRDDSIYLRDPRFGGTSSKTLFRLRQSKEGVPFVQFVLKKDKEVIYSLSLTQGVLVSPARRSPLVLRGDFHW